MQIPGASRLLLLLRCFSAPLELLAFNLLLASRAFHQGVVIFGDAARTSGPRGKNACMRHVPNSCVSVIFVNTATA